MISVVIPVLNEEGNIKSLISEILAESSRAPISEIIYVDDGSTDSTPAILQELKQTVPILRVLRHDKRSGQSAAMWTGIKYAQNDIIATLDGDGQNNPADIHRLYNMYVEQKAKVGKVMIAGQRVKRQDTFARRLASRFANTIRSSLLRDKTRDTGCSLKMFSRESYLGLPYFNHMHRFLPALMMRDGVTIAHVDVSHRPRTHGISKYTNFKRALVGVSDLLGVMWLQRRPHAFPHIFEMTL